MIIQMRAPGKGVLNPSFSRADAAPVEALVLLAVVGPALSSCWMFGFDKDGVGVGVVIAPWLVVPSPFSPFILAIPDPEPVLLHA